MSFGLASGFPFGLSPGFAEGLFPGPLPGFAEGLSAGFETFGLYLSTFAGVVTGRAAVDGRVLTGCFLSDETTGLATPEGFPEVEGLATGLVVVFGFAGFAGLAVAVCLDWPEGLPALVPVLRSGLAEGRVAEVLRVADEALPCDTGRVCDEDFTADDFLSDEIERLTDLPDDF